MARILMAAYTHYRRDPRVRREAEALVEQGHEVTFLASRQPGEPVRETLEGVQVVKLPTLGHRRRSILGYLLDYALFFVLLNAHLLRHPRRYALVHVNNMPDFLVFATWPHRLAGGPVIHDVHDLMPELYATKFPGAGRRWLGALLAWQERCSGRYASAVLTVEERLRDILAGRGLPRERIHVLMNLPDEKLFRPRAAVAKPAGAPFVLVYHGTLARRLGVDLAIEAVARARGRAPDLELRIIGAGEERAGLIALRDRLGLQAQVHFSEGFVPVQRMPSLLAEADLGLVPLRAEAATDVMLPTKLLEYVALGIPCIVPRTGTITRYFDASMVCFFEAGDADALADAIVALRADAARRAALSAEASRRFGEVYRWSSHRRVYTGLVERLIAADGARPTP